MSFLDKGTTTATAIVSRDPDRGGNFVSDGTVADVEINAALVYVNVFGSGKVVVKQGAYTITARISVGVYTILDLGKATLTLANGVNDDFIAMNDDSTLRGGYLDGNSAGQAASSQGVRVFEKVRVRIIDTEITDTYADGVYIRNSSDVIVERLRITDTGRQGIAIVLTSSRIWLLNNYIAGTTNWGVDIEIVDGQNTEDLFINYNYIYQPGQGGIAVGSDGTKNRVWIIGNDIHETQAREGIYANTGSNEDLFIVDNYVYLAFTHGIKVVNGLKTTVMGNHVDLSGEYGMHINSPRSRIVGNLVENSDSAGLLPGDYITIVGNIFRNNGQDDGDPYRYGIQLWSDAECTIVGNIIYDDQGTKTQQYAIFEMGTADFNLITGNNLKGNDVGSFTLIGSGTRAFDNAVDGVSTISSGVILDSVPFQFVLPRAADWVAVPGSPAGIHIDTAGDGAILNGHIPIKVHQVIRIRIFAVALDNAPAGGNMHIEAVMYAGAPHENYLTAAKSWGATNWDSEETDYVTDDVITWLIEDGDVGNELRNLAAGDKITLWVNYVPGEAPDAETDAIFGSIALEYI